MRLYLDLCCFNRPFDDQEQLLVRLQTEAKLAVQESILSGRHELVWSAILDVENQANPDQDRSGAIQQWKLLAKVDIAATSTVEQLADDLRSSGLKAMDALHLAAAIEAQSDFFLTTDKEILRKTGAEIRIRVIDPIDFVRGLSEADYED